jgi:hypothetical protein
MTTSSYFIAWIIYLLAASGVCLIAWKLSAHWRITLSYVSRAALLVLLFTPYFSDPAQNKLAPAILITLFEFVFGDSQMALESGTPLALLLAISMLLSLIYALSRRHAK